MRERTIQALLPAGFKGEGGGVKKQHLMLLDKSIHIFEEDALYVKFLSD